MGRIRSVIAYVCGFGGNSFLILGVSCSHSQANSFHRVGASIFQKFSLRQPFSVTEKSTVKNSEPVSLLFQLKGMLSHGGGLIPHFHYESLSGNIVRGHKPSSSSQCPLCERDDSAMSYVAAKVLLQNVALLIYLPTDISD